MNARHGASCAPKPLDRTAEITTTPLPKADLERASRTPSAVEVCPSARSRVGDEVVAPRRHATGRPWQSDREPDSRPRVNWLAWNGRGRGMWFALAPIPSPAGSGFTARALAFLFEPYSVFCVSFSLPS